MNHDCGSFRPNQPFYSGPPFRSETKMSGAIVKSEFYGVSSTSSTPAARSAAGVEASVHAPPPARSAGGGAEGGEAAASTIQPPSFVRVTPPHCFVCLSLDFRTLMNPHFNPPNTRGLLCSSCFVKACPSWWKRNGDDIRLLIERNFCSLEKAAERHASLLTFFRPALKCVPGLVEQAHDLFYLKKEDFICMYAFDQQKRPRRDYFLSHTVVEANVFNWMQPGRRKTKLAKV